MHGPKLALSRPTAADGPGVLPVREEGDVQEPVASGPDLEPFEGDVDELRVDLIGRLAWTLHSNIYDSGDELIFL